MLLSVKIWGIISAIILFYIYLFLILLCESA